MIRGATYNQWFNIKNEGVDASVIAKVNVLYGKDDKQLFRKKNADCTVEGNTIHTKLTRDETLMFDHNKPAQIQVIVETSTGDILETTVREVGIDKLLDDGVIE